MSLFEGYRNAILGSLEKFDVPYKLFGGAVVQLIHPERQTEDLDIFIKKNKEILNRLLLALDDCGFDTLDSLNEQFFGEGISDGKIEDLEYPTYRIYSAREEWSEFHIDLSFGINDFNYENTPEEVIDHDGIKIHTVSYLGVAKMKASIKNIGTGEFQPREKDIEDMDIIARHLNIDPATGEPIVAKEKKKRWWQV